MARGLGKEIKKCLNLPVLTSEGDILGRIADFTTGQDGSVTLLTVRSSRDGKTIAVPMDQVVGIGPDVVILCSTDEVSAVREVIGRDEGPGGRPAGRAPGRIRRPPDDMRTPRLEPVGGPSGEVTWGAGQEEREPSLIDAGGRVLDQVLRGLAESIGELARGRAEAPVLELALDDAVQQLPLELVAEPEPEIAAPAAPALELPLAFELAAEPAEPAVQTVMDQAEEPVEPAETIEPVVGDATKLKFAIPEEHPGRTGVRHWLARANSAQNRAMGRAADRLNRGARRLRGASGQASAAVGKAVLPRAPSRVREDGGRNEVDPAELLYLTVALSVLAALALTVAYLLVRSAVSPL